MFEEYITYKKIEVAERKKQKPLSTIQTLAEESNKDVNIGESLLHLSNKPSHLITEFMIKPPHLEAQMDAPLEIANYYQNKGCSAFSVMTDEKIFGGSLELMRRFSLQTNLPIIRHDFIVDEYQIFETKAYLGDSYILRADILDTALLQYFTEIGRDLKMEAMILVNNPTELQKAIDTDNKIIICNFNRLNKNRQPRFPTAMMDMMERDNQGRIVLCGCEINDIETFSKVGYKSFVVPAMHTLTTTK